MALLSANRFRVQFTSNPFSFLFIEKLNPALRERDLLAATSLYTVSVFRLVLGREVDTSDFPVLTQDMTKSIGLQTKWGDGRFIEHTSK